MENRFKMRISRMFRSSFGSCRTRNMSDIVEKAVFVPQNHGPYPEFESLKVLSSPKPRPFPSGCKPKCSQITSETIHGDTAVRVNDSLPRKKVSERSSASIWGSALDGWSCPPASPISPLNPFSHCKELGFIDRTKTKTSESYRRSNKKKKKKNSTRVRTSRELFPFSSSSMDSSYGGSWWYSSDDDDDREDETDTLFSSRSLSSNSSGSRRKKQRNRQRRTVILSSEVGVLPLPGKVKDSFAVVKKSSDPYSDFRTSMVEMIVEKRIFSPSGLENLLQCFLSLNSHHHHKIIVEVFTEIWEALFSNWS